MANLGKNGGYFSEYKLHFKNNNAILTTERDSVIMGKNDLIWTIVNKLKFGSFANTYADSEHLGAQLNFEILIDGFKAEDVKSGSVCMVSISINWDEDEEFLTPLGFSRSNDGAILLNGLDYQDNLDEETFSKARDILSYYLESYEELKPKC
jgi:hypothetical protein